MIVGNFRIELTEQDDSWFWQISTVASPVKNGVEATKQLATNNALAALSEVLGEKQTAVETMSVSHDGTVSNNQYESDEIQR